MSVQLVIDVRKAFDSGIGTYIRSVVPRVIDRFAPYSVALICEEKKSAQHSSYLGGRAFHMRTVPSRPLSIQEQWTLRKTMGEKSLYWATSLAHPLFSRMPMIAMVHDVAQLAVPGVGGGGFLVRSTSRIFLESLRRRARLLLFNSEFTRTEFARHVGRSTSPQCVTPLGVEPRWFDATTEPKVAFRAPYFVCVGNLRPHKNLALLFSAFSSLLNQLPHHLVVIGQHKGFRTSDPTLHNVMRALSARVHFLGHVSDEDLRQYVAAADALVFPSLYEGFGLPVLEAMAARCPVIASSAGALPEVGSNVVRYFNPQSPQSLASALQDHAAIGEAERSSMLDAGVARARQFTWDRTADLTVAALRKALLVD